MIARLLTAAAILAAAAPATPAPSPGEIVAAAPASAWVAIDPADLLVMTLAPDAKGRARQVILQLMPPPFSQGWVGNIRKLATAHWWDGTSINRVQDNYVVQWGDANGEDITKAKPLPTGLVTMAARNYESRMRTERYDINVSGRVTTQQGGNAFYYELRNYQDSYVGRAGFAQGWPFGSDGRHRWPIHCYAMVGVGRNLSPDAGSGVELYTVIGHAPRHLDRNIALVGRVIEGIEHLSSLPRGTEALGFYKTAEERTAIVSIRLASDLPAAEQPRFEYLSTGGDTFAHYADARANRRDPFFIRPAGGADICNIPVPVRRKP